MKYLDQEINMYNTADLTAVLATLNEAEAKRNTAANDPRFIKLGFPLPPPNPEFLKLKTAIETELASRN